MPGRRLFPASLWRGLRRRLVSTVVLLAFAAEALGSVVPHAAAATIPCVMMMGSAAQADDSSAAAADDPSSKGTLPPCGSDLRCIVAAALPEPFAPVAADLAWQPVLYLNASEALPGLSIPPDISPPRSRA